MKTRIVVAFCCGLIALFAANGALSQVYDPTFGQLQSAANELSAQGSNCAPGGTGFANGAITGVDPSVCPAVAGLLGHYNLSDFYGQISLEVDVSGNPFFKQTLTSSTPQTKAYLDGIGTQFSNLFGPLGSSGGFTYTGVEPVNAILTIEGLKIVGSVPANSNTITVDFPQLTKYGPNGFQLVGTGATRAAAIDNLGAQVSGMSNTQLQTLAQSVLAYWAQSSSTDLLAGNPASAQGVAVRNAMNLDEDDSVIDDAGGGGAGASASGQNRAAANAGSWLVGLDFGTTYDGSDYNGSPNSNQIDGQVQKNWRIFEGQRTRLQLTLPINYSDLDGRQALQGGAAIGLEQPIFDGRWSLEPQISWGFAVSNKIESIGHIAAATLTSRYRIDGIGRGYFIIGNMIGYTETLSTAMFGAELNPHLRNWVFRNGVAYELPLNFMVMGRGASVRASYEITNFTGDPLFLNQFQEAALSFGVRSREGVLHNSYEALRLGITALWGDRYSQVSGVIGFRF